MEGVDYFKARYGLRDQSVLLFPYGSRVYGTTSDKSDHDYNAVILDRRNSVQTGEEYRHGDTNIHIYTRNDWQHQLNEHKIHTLEALYLPDGVCKSHFNFDLDLTKLRHSLSEKASHSFVKARKKIEKEKNFYIGWKSLFHSLRILTFGTQIAEMGKITDYSAANQYWFDILREPHYEWAWFDEKYGPVYNELATRFRKVAPKLARK
jgi:predicted nucleotidyltransferase